MRTTVTIILAVLLVAALPAAGQCTKWVQNPHTGKMDCASWNLKLVAPFAPADADVLTYSAADGAWKPAANPAGFADPMTTRGDLIYRSNTGTTRLPLGAAGQTLSSNGTDVLWQTMFPGCTKADAASPLVCTGGVSTGDGDAAAGLILPETTAGGGTFSFRIYGAEDQAEDGCIVLSGQPSDDKILRATGSTTAIDGKTCRVMAWEDLPSASAPAPFFASPATNHTQGNWTPTQDIVKCHDVYFPTAVSTSKVVVRVTTADSENHYSLGITTLAGTTLASTAPFSAHYVDYWIFPWQQGTVTIPAGWNAFCLTGDAATLTLGLGPSTVAAAFHGIANFGAPHSDLMGAADGQQYWVMTCDMESPCGRYLYAFRLNSGAMMAVDEASGGGRHEIMLLHKCGGPPNYWVGNHIGCAKKAPYCAVSTDYNGFRDPGDLETPVSRGTHMSEIMIVALDSVRRMAQARSVTWDGTADQEYWSYPRVCLSNDGTMALWDTNLGYMHDYQNMVAVVAISPEAEVGGRIRGRAALTGGARLQ